MNASDTSMLFSLYFRFSKSSDAKALTTRCPVRFSCKTVFSSAIISWIFSHACRSLRRMMPETSITGGIKLMASSPSCKSIRKSITETTTMSSAKYGVRMMPIFTNIRMFSTSVIARDIRCPVWFLS